MSFETAMPPPGSLPSLIGPPIVTVPPLRLRTETLPPPPSLIVPGKVTVPEPPSRLNAGPEAAVEREGAAAAAENVPAPRPASEMPCVVLPDELTVSRSRPPIVVPETLSAGPPVAEMFAVPPPGTLTVPAELISSAGAVPDVVVRFRSVPEPLPSCVVPERLNSRTPPLPEPVTVMSSNTLPVPMFVVSASSAAAPLVVTEIVPAERKFTVPAPLRTMPFALAGGVVAALLSTVRSEML